MDERTDLPIAVKLSWWDEAAKTLTWKTELADGISMTNKVQFLDKDTCKWVLVAKDKGGKVYLDMEGKLTRSK